MNKPLQINKAPTTGEMVFAKLTTILPYAMYSHGELERSDTGFGEITD